jgi:hypothetical protein
LFIFHFIYGIIIPTDELIFFRGVGQPPTSSLFLFFLGKTTLHRSSTIPQLIQKLAQVITTLTGVDRAQAELNKRYGLIKVR